MALVRMKPPVGVSVGLGADDKLYYIDGQGFANVDSGSVTKLTAEGWVSAVPVAPEAPGNTFPVSATKTLTGGRVFSAAGIEIQIDALFQSSTPIVSPLDTVNNVLLGVNIPGGSMGKNGRLQIRMMWSYTNNANTKTIKVRFGGSLAIYSCGLGSQSGANIIVDLVNRGDESVQIATPTNVNGTLAALAQPFVNGNIDTSTDQLLTFECLKATGTDVITLEAVFVEVLK